MSDLSAIIEWQGEEYEITYSFALIRKLKAHGVNFPKLYIDITTDAANANDEQMGLIAMQYGDEIAELVSAILRHFGAKKCTPEAVYNHAMVERGYLGEILSLVFWLGSKHFRIGADADVDSDAKKKP